MQKMQEFFTRAKEVHDQSPDGLEGEIIREMSLEMLQNWFYDVPVLPEEFVFSHANDFREAEKTQNRFVAVFRKLGISYDKLYVWGNDVRVKNMKIE